MSIKTTVFILELNLHRFTQLR